MRRQRALSYRESVKQFKRYEKECDESFRTRMRRALNWFGRAEREMRRRDFDAAFVFYWIAFNAAYGKDQLWDERGEKDILFDFLYTILERDKHHCNKRLFEELDFLHTMRDIVANEYIYQGFWNSRKKGEHQKKKFRELHQTSQDDVRQALKDKNMRSLFESVFDKLYTLRNQLMHGAATWGGGVNRKQVEDGAKSLCYILPYILTIMVDNRHEDWGEVPYPPI